jgi:curved DNA-binding protein CbpA
MQQATKDICKLLGLSRGASQDELRKAHRKLVREYHPGANPDDPAAEERFKAVQQAYEVLSNPEKKRRYDDIRWHDLRHTCATLLLGRGVHPKLVQHLLGHASITLTLDRYSHGIPSMGKHNCRWQGGGFGIESTAAVLLTKTLTRTSWASRFYGFCRKNREPTSGLEPLTCSLRVSCSTC